jgi:pyruvate kinase
LIPSAPAARLAGRLERVRTSVLELERSVDLAPFGPQRESARNLLHYLAFRRFDFRKDQTRLANWGLSSLGRSESHVLYNLNRVIGWLSPAQEAAASRSTGGELGPERAAKILASNAEALFGPTRPGRRVRIMVTMPSEAATDYRLVRGLIESGMDCARINCAHDGPAEWASMVSNIRRASRALGRRCRIQMDLPGPKIRTGTFQPGPPVLKVRPTRDTFGHVTAPGHFWFAASSAPRSPEIDERTVVVDPSWLLRRHAGERVILTDSRGARRAVRLMTRVGDFVRAETSRTVYIVPGTRLEATTLAGAGDVVEVVSVPLVEQRIRLHTGDRLVVTARPEPGEEARRDRRGRVRVPAHVPCTLPEALRFVRRGEAIWFDDGRIGSVVRSANPTRLVVEITHAPAAGAWLAADRGINLPESALEIPPLSPQDVASLGFIVRHADLVGLSFAQAPSDLERLRRELARLRRPRMGVVLKIETRRGFEELPELLLSALRLPPTGVMIARGDLAVEVGFVRLAEVQEEILWLCEAAHIPAVWATQVLEGLAKTGMPSRAEVTDAAMGERAECVMLNKGPHVAGAVRALDSILRRMQSHQAKKTAMLRHLHVVERFFETRMDSLPARMPSEPVHR